METKMNAETRRTFYRKKITYKRHIIFFLWAAFLAYFSIASGRAEEPNSGLASLNAGNQNSPPGFATAGVHKQKLLLRSVRSVGLGVGDNSTDTDESGLVHEDYGDLVEGLNCTPPAIADFPRDLFTQEQRANGAVAVHFLVSLYIFYWVALVCDDFFVPSIECICDDLRIPSDVGGATFMAIATSAPELFTNVVGTFITQGDIGIGTIVGSAVFNILAIGACCGLAAREPLQLEWWPLTRDCVFYSLSVVLLIVTLLNRAVHWYEALVLVIFYLIYIGVMYKNTTLKEKAERFVDECLHGKKRRNAERNTLSIRGVTPPRQVTETTALLCSSSNGEHEQKRKKGEPGVGVGSGNVSPLESSSEPRGYSEEGEADENDDYNGNPGRKGRRLSVGEYDELLISQALQKSVAHAKEEEEEGGLFILPRGASGIEWFEWIIGWPVRFCLTITMPDCRQPRWRRWYPLTFVVCILWIGSLSYVVSWMMTVIGHTLHIPDSVMGLTFIAAGTSVPEAVSSIIVSRQGLGAMGISNSIGSNTFDILICLGVPWLIRGAIIANSEVDYILINSTGLAYSSILLIVSLFMLYILLACNRFVLDKKTGFIALFMYGIFLIIASLVELNVIFPKVNLPVCPTNL